MLKVRVNCPICGENVLAKSLEKHLENVHELTGTVLLRLNPTHPYAHKPEAEVVELAPEEAEGGREETATATTPEPATEPEPEAEPEEEA